MKTSIFLLSALLSSSAVYGATSVTPPSTLQEGLEIYMNFDTANKNAYDSYGLYAGSISGGSNSTGQTGQAFAGSAGYNEWGSYPGATDLNSTNISTQNFTVNFQFRNWKLLGTHVVLSMGTSAGQTLQLLRQGEALNLSVTGANSESVGIMDPSSLWNNSLWQSFTMTSSSTGLEFYLNGVSIHSSSKVLDAGLLNEFKLVSGGSGGNAADVKIDDFGLWSRALTADEIKFLATKTASTAMPSAAVPEPGSASLALLGLSGFLIRRRRSRNS